MYFGNLPEYDADQVLIDNSTPTFYADVLEPAGSDNTALWVFLGIVALLFLTGKNKGGEPLSNPPFKSRKYPQHVSGYYAHAYYRRKRK
jgi:hypothetical protein